MNDPVAPVVSILVMLTMLAMLFAVAGQRDNLKKEAVERGVAERVVDSNGNTTWKWKE